MRHTAAGLNRGWLAVLGVLLLLGGALLTVITTGALAPLAASLGSSVDGPDPQRPFASGGAVWSTTWVAVVVVAGGVVLALLGLLWLAAQVPRSRPARPFRLHDSADDGLTRCDPDVLADAVARHTESLPGVLAASAVIRGTASQPDLTVRVTASERADVARLLERIDTAVVGGVAQALDTQVSRLGVQVEIERGQRTSREITVQPA